MPRKEIDLSTISEEELLNLRICDLPLNIEGTWVKDCIEDLYKDLDRKKIQFKPLCYLADEWLAPDKEPVIGIPFFLTHPALIKLEKKMVLDAEGSTKAWCMKLLRHEAGHAINYAYKLYRRRRWQKIFGQFSKEYEDTYRFRPYSKAFVRHLEDYYAQYHPDEDFAETFAVWLTPELNWPEQYKGWKAITKLNYVDKLMRDIGKKEPLVKKGKKYWEAAKTKATLKNFYKKKRKSYAEYFPDFHDSNLKKIFILSDMKLSDTKTIGQVSQDRELSSAGEIIKKYKKNILDIVARWTGERKYIINELIETLINRSKSLKLKTDRSEPVIILEIAAYITTLVMNYSYTGGFRKG